MAFFGPFFWANIRNTVPLPPKKTKNKKQKTKWHLIEIRGPPFPPSKNKVLFWKTKKMLFLNSRCGLSAQNHKLCPERQFLVTTPNSEQAFKQK